MPSHLSSLLIGLATAAIGACGFDDLFQETGAGDVRFVSGDTLVIRGQTIPFRVELWVGGVQTTSPAVQRQIPDTTRIRFNATGDSITGVQVGRGDVVLWIESSLAPRVDTTLSIRIRP